MTKIDLITGILGSGKTTFIKKYASHLIEKGERIAILENDFGAVNVDMMILQELKCDNCTIEMIMGGGDHDCHRRRFKTQLISLGMQNYDRVIVEPSGIFDMDEFFDLLYESPLDKWYSIGSVIGIADAETEDVLSEQMEYLLASEAACCGKIYISKLDENSDIDGIKTKLISHISRELENIRCDRKITENDLVAVRYDELDGNILDMLENAGYRGAMYVKKFSPEEIKSSVHYFMHIAIAEDKIKGVTESIINDSRCGRIFRIKGSLPSENGKWLKVNATKERTELSEVENGQPVLIVIGDDISKERIDAYLTEFNTDSEYVSV